MFIHVLKQKNGRAYVYLKESRRNAAGMTKSVIVRNFGRLDKLLEQDPQALEKLKAKYNGTGNSSTIKRARIEEMARQVLSGDDAGKELEALPSVNYGMMPLLKVWKDDLKLDYFFNYLRKRNPKLDFDVASCVEFLCFILLVDPAQASNALNNAPAYAGDFLRGITLEELRRTCDFLAESKDKIISFVNKRLNEEAGSGHKAATVFCDVTCACFENKANAGSSKTSFIDELADEAMLFGEDGKFLGIDFAMLPPNARRLLKGSCLENCSLPVYSIAMAVDDSGMPIDFQLFSGAAGTVTQIVGEMKKRLRPQDQILVADRGINAGDDLDGLLSSGCGFIAKQKVSCLEKTVQDALLSDEGWTWRSDDTKYKAIPDYEITGPDGRKFRCTLILVWSRKQASREVARHEMLDSISGRIISQADSAFPGNDTQTASMSQEKNRELYGYSALICRGANDSSCGLTPDRIIDSLSMLDETERNLKNMKTKHLRTISQLTGQILLRVLALLLARHIQARLEAKGRHMSIEAIASALRTAWITPLVRKGSDIGNSNFSYVWSNLCGNSQFSCKDDKGKAPCHEGSAANPASCKTALDAVLEACGLEPLPALFDRAVFSKCMGKRFGKDEDLVGKEMVDHLAAEGILKRS
jgi:hypothetical protein